MKKENCDQVKKIGKYNMQKLYFEILASAL